MKLGKWLRERYNGWLPELYSYEDVYVRSTDYDRTIMSAQANLAGMYPINSKKGNGLLKKLVQLVPIHTVPLFDDNVCNIKFHQNLFDSVILCHSKIFFYNNTC